MTMRKEGVKKILNGVVDGIRTQSRPYREFQFSLRISLAREGLAQVVLTVSPGARPRGFPVQRPHRLSRKNEVMRFQSRPS